MDSRTALTDEVLEGFRKMFHSQEKNVPARNVCSGTDLFDTAESSDILEEMQPVFNHKIEPEGKPMSDQKGTGLCWLFSGLNLIRLPFMKEYNLEEFEFSQAHLLFWYKIEASNTFLYNMVKTAQNREPLDGRLMTFLLGKPISDAGFWHILASLVNKHGLMPKKNFPEAFNSSNTSKMNEVLQSMLRQYAKAIRDLVAKDGCDEDIDNLIQDQMSNIYRVVGICLGIPTDTFTWNYYDKDKAYKTIGPVTPKEFYEKHVKAFFNVDDKVCLVSDPRPTFEYGKLFTTDYVNDVVEAKNCLFNNQPVELLLDLTAKSIKQGGAVLSCYEVSRQFSWRHGMHLKTYDFKLLLGVDIETTLSKADRILYIENSLAHAVIFTGIKTNDDGEVTKLRAENSWGEECGDKGYLTMTDDFFKEFTIEIVVDRKFVPKEVLEVFKQEPVVTPVVVQLRKPVMFLEAVVHHYFATTVKISVVSVFKPLFNPVCIK